MIGAKSASMLSLSLLILALAPRGALAIIHQISSFAEIETLTSRDSAVLPSETLLLFDLDNTLMTPITDLGSDQWFYCLYQALGAVPLQDASLDEKLVGVWNRVQSEIVVEASEDGFAQWIKHKQSLGFQAMALTARSFNMLDVSIRQLDSIGISLHAEQAEEEIIPKELLSGVEEAKYRHGILAIGESNVKAKALQVFLQSTRARESSLGRIKKIIFVDDKDYHCEAMNALVMDGIQAIESYRYGRLDERVKRFQCDVPQAKSFLERDL